MGKNLQKKKRVEKITALSGAKYTHRIGVVEESAEFYFSKKRISNACNVLEFCQDLYTRQSLLYEETFYIVALTCQNEPIAINSFVGSTTSVQIPIQKIFQFLLLVNAQAFFCVHNHPSGEIIPSISDDKLTMKLKEISNIHEIRMIDHVIVTISKEQGINTVSKSNYYSYKEKGTF